MLGALQGWLSRAGFSIVQDFSITYLQLYFYDNGMLDCHSFSSCPPFGAFAILGGLGNKEPFFFLSPEWATPSLLINEKPVIQ